MPKPKQSTKFPLVPAAVIVLLLLFYGAFLCHRINLAPADLGRHLKSGEIFFQSFSPIATNFYSYTAESYPSINHHWGSGVVFFSIYQIAGFVGLQFFFIALSLVTFGILFRFACTRASLGVATLLAVPFIPLLAERTEIRPEVFSYLFCAIFYVLLWQFIEGRQSFRVLLLAPALEIFWANTHIYFFLGPLFILAFFLHCVASPVLRPMYARRLAVLLALTVTATVVSPFGVRGALVPWTIFQNYGTAITENQPVWIVERIIRNPNYSLFKADFALLAVSFMVAWSRNRKQIPIADALLAVGVSAMAWAQVRNFTLFGLFAFVSAAANLGLSYRRQLEHKEGTIRTIALAFAFVVFLIVVSADIPSLYPYWNEFGWGLEAENSKAAEFVRAEKVAGPIFNNYDIGGYLIFHLFPDYRVFVDNRPEAYPSSFFREIYFPILENEAGWQKAREQYRFNAIVLSPREASAAGRRFFFRRFNDPEWAPVFGDSNAVVFLKRNEVNRSIIQRYEIPKEMFRFVNQ